MKIATFNANSIRARLPIILDWLNANSPDVLCVQETKVQDKDFPEAEFEKNDYEFAYSGEKSYNGVAIFSRHHLSDVEFGLDDEPTDNARLLKAVVGDTTIINTYIPQGYSADSEKFQYKLDWFSRLNKYIKARFAPTDKLIWLGDFNIAPRPRFPAGQCLLSSSRPGRFGRGNGVRLYRPVSPAQHKQRRIHVLGLSCAQRRQKKSRLAIRPYYGNRTHRPKVHKMLYRQTAAAFAKAQRPYVSDCRTRIK